MPPAAGQRLAASQRAALHICQDRHATPLADRAAAALADLAGPSERHADLNGPGHDGPGMRDLRAAIRPTGAGPRPLRVGVPFARALDYRPRYVMTVGCGRRAGSADLLGSPVRAAGGRGRS